MLKKVSKNDERIRRHIRVRTKISGTPERPRLNVFRSNSHIHDVGCLQQRGSEAGKRRKYRSRKNCRN